MIPKPKKAKKIIGSKKLKHQELSEVSPGGIQSDDSIFDQGSDTVIEHRYFRI